MSTALVTGGSRGVGKDTAIALAERGFDVAVTCREKLGRAEEVVDAIQQLGRNAIAIVGDITVSEERASLVQDVRNWAPEHKLGCLVLNASGGLEKGKDPDYPMLMNHDAQVGLVNDFQPLLSNGSTIAFITSHWAHMYGQVEQLPQYGKVGESKHKGEIALREMQDGLTLAAIRLLVVTGDVVDGTIIAAQLRRKHPEIYDSRRNDEGKLITTRDMGIAIANAVTDSTLETGSTVVVGGSLDSLPRLAL